MEKTQSDLEEVTFGERLDNKKPAWEGVCAGWALLRAEGTAGAKVGAKRCLETTWAGVAAAGGGRVRAGPSELAGWAQMPYASTPSPGLLLKVSCPGSALCLQGRPLGKDLVPFSLGSPGPGTAHSHGKTSSPGLPYGSGIYAEASAGTQTASGECGGPRSASS